MPPRTKLTKAHKDGIRVAALARHAARKAAGLPSFTGQAYATPATPAVPLPAPVTMVRLGGPVSSSPPAGVDAPWPHPPAAAAPPRRAPLVRLRDDGTPVPPKPVPVIPEVPRPPVDPAPRLAFQAWLGGPVGRGASDPRMSPSPSRMAAELEHALWLAFQAGQAVGMVTTEEAAEV